MVSQRADVWSWQYVHSIRLCESDSDSRTVEAVGYCLRIYGHSHLNTYVPYVVMQAFTVSLALH